MDGQVPTHCLERRKTLRRRRHATANDPEILQKKKRKKGGTSGPRTPPVATPLPWCSPYCLTFGRLWADAWPD